MASVQLDTTTSYNTIVHTRNIEMAVTRLYALYNDDSVLVYRYSDDDGATWSAAVTVATGNLFGSLFYDGTNGRMNFVYAGGNNTSVSLRFRAITTNVASGVPGALTTEQIIDAGGPNSGVNYPFGMHAWLGANPRYWVGANKVTAAGTYEFRLWYVAEGAAADTAANWTAIANVGSVSGTNRPKPGVGVRFAEGGAQKLMWVFCSDSYPPDFVMVKFDPTAATPAVGTPTTGLFAVSGPGSPEFFDQGAVMGINAEADYVVFGRLDTSTGQGSFYKLTSGTTWSQPTGWAGLPMGRFQIARMDTNDFYLVHATSYGGLATTSSPLLWRKITTVSDTMGATSALSDTNGNGISIPRDTEGKIFVLYRGSTASPYTVRSDSADFAAVVSIGRPSADSVDGAWTDQAGATVLFSAIDEVTASDADYIRSELTPSASATRVKIATITDPASSTGHVIRWRIARDMAGGNQIDMTVSLRQGGGAALGGGTLIAAFTRSNVIDTWTTYEETLSAAQADSITNYADLYFEFSATETVASTAFPITNLIDNFTRANEDPVANGWSGPIITTDGRGRVLSNQLAAPAAGATARDYWTTSFGADQEIWMTVATLPGASGSAGVKGRIVNPNVSTVDYYEFVYTVGTGWRMFRVVNAGYTQIGSTVTTPALAAGDSIGFELIGSTLRGMHKTAGVWSQIMSVSDSTITAGGFIGHECSDATVRADDFGGGEVS